MHLFAGLQRTCYRPASFYGHLIAFVLPSDNPRVLAGMRRRVKHINTVLDGAIIEHGMQILEHLTGMEIGYNLSNTEYELCSIRLDFILFLDLIVAESVL